MLYPRVLARLEFLFEIPFPASSPRSIVQNRPYMEYSQVVRHRFLVPACKGSNPFTPDYEHPIGSVKNELADDYRGSFFQARNPSPACSKPKVLLFSTLFAKRRERKERQMAESNPSNQPTCGVEHNTNFGQVLPEISWPLLNSLFRKPVAG